MHKKFILLIFVCILGFPTTAFAQDSIAVGDSVTGDENQAQWQLFLEAGQFVQIDLTSDTFDTFLALSNEAGDVLMSNDDIAFPSNTNSQIIFNAQDSSNYILSVKSFGSDIPKGAYTLTVTELEITAQLSQGELLFAEPLTVAPKGAASVEFTFQGVADELVNISAVSAMDEDTNLSLYDPKGNLIATADDNRAGKNPYLLRFKLPQTGQYSLVIKGFNDAPLFSPLDVSLEKTEELRLNDSSQSVLLGGSKTQDLMVLDTNAGQTYLITVSLSEATASSLFLDLEEQGEEFAGTRLSASGLDILSFVFVAKKTGQARLYLSFFSFDASDVKFTVQVQSDSSSGN